MIQIVHKNGNVLILFLSQAVTKELLLYSLRRIHMEIDQICVFWSRSLNTLGYVTGKLLLVSIILRSW